MKRSGTFLTTLLLSVSSLAMASSHGTPNVPNITEKVEIVNKEQGLYNLVYKTASTGNFRYKVSILDSKGHIVFAENFISETSFSKLFNFSKMDYGTYTMVITNGTSEKISKEIVHQPVHNLKVDLAKLDEKGKFNLSIQGLNKKPVRVIILDRDQREIYNEMIDIKSDFSRLFDLNRVVSSIVTFKVLFNGELIEKTINL